MSIAQPTFQMELNKAKDFLKVHGWVTQLAGDTHQVVKGTDKRTIYGRKLIQSRSWASFQLYQRKDGSFSIRARNVTINWDGKNPQELQRHLRGLECL